MALEGDSVRGLFALVGSDAEPAQPPVPYLEPLPIELPRSLLEMDEPLPAAALDRLRRQIDEQSHDDRREKSSSQQEGLYPRRMLIVDHAATDDRIDAER